MEGMKYVFFGTPRFAEVIFRGLISKGLVPQAIVTAPDALKGKKKVLTPSLVKQAALEMNEKLGVGIKIFTPMEFDASFSQELESLQAECFVLAAYGRILPQWLVELPPKGVVGVHPSMLPKYRGATPIQTAIMNGETETGTSVFVLNAGVDTGGILAQRRVEIAKSDTYESLEQKLAQASLEALVEALPLYRAGGIAPHRQSEERATLTKKIQTEDGFILIYDVRDAIENGGEKANKIHNIIRALHLEPGAFTVNESDERVKLLGSRLDESGKLVLTKIQKAGEKVKEGSNLIL
ncbi:MAG: hypothetical protein FJY91_01490 [Candidatus Harrisonbacteria bacterium]|nr:hypothetical protein [Candidatus Harrisonbacteria bacterium]